MKPVDLPVIMAINDGSTALERIGLLKTASGNDSGH